MRTAMDLKEFYNSQSEVVKAKIKACNSVEEMKQVLDEENIELDPEMLDEHKRRTLNRWAQNRW